MDEGMVGATGFEPVTTRTPSVCATRLRYAPTVSSCRKCNIPPELNQFKQLIGTPAKELFVFSSCVSRCATESIVV